MDRKTLEQQLFTWESWDQEGPMSLSFIDVVLVSPIGEFPVGTKFPDALLLGDASLLVLRDEEGKENAFELKLSTGAKVDLSSLDLEEDVDDHENCTHHSHPHTKH